MLNGNYGVPFACINMDTEIGIVQIIAYNDHNGYYPHDIRVSWKNFSDRQRI
jgi:hypothetical protein